MCDIQCVTIQEKLHRFQEFAVTPDCSGEFYYANLD